VIKLVFCLRKREDLSFEEFQRIWREEHAPLVARHAEALRIKRYVQTHTVDTPFNAALKNSRGGPDGYDGVAELWWDSLEDAAGAAATPEGAQAAAKLLEDERRFIDLTRSPLFVANEHEIVG
jgi:uncharacterized protein (TIGR02118 family)